MNEELFKQFYLASQEVKKNLTEDQHNVNLYSSRIDKYSEILQEIISLPEETLPKQVLDFVKALDDTKEICKNCYLSSLPFDHPARHPKCTEKSNRYFATKNNLIEFCKQFT